MKYSAYVLFVIFYTSPGIQPDTLVSVTLAQM